METFAFIAFLLGVVAYSASSALFFVFLVRGELSGVRAASATALLAGATFHGAHVVFASLLSGACPVGSIHFGLSLTAVVLVFGFLHVRRSRSIDALGVFVAPLALTFLVAAEFVGRPVAPGPTVALRIFHVAANLAGLGFVLLAGSTSALYLVVERRLKQKRLKFTAGRLPPLEGLDSLAYRMLLYSLPLLTAGAVTGALFLKQIEAMSGLAFARVVLGYGVWAIVLGVVLSRSLGGFRGRRMAVWTLLGMVGLLLVLGAYLFLPLGGGAT